MGGCNRRHAVPGAAAERSAIGELREGDHGTAPLEAGAHAISERDDEDTRGGIAMSIDTGDRAPDFELPRDGGGTVALAEHAGKPVVVYFYPKDDTSGCTKEAIAFTERADDFAVAGAVVIGISKDSVATHDKFKAKHGLNIVLASDAEGDVCERYGVWVEKSMYGRKYMGIDRSTFLVDGDGTVRRTWRKVKVPGHVDEVLEAIRSIA
jgi:thioredoxin-dependent peroxiredoxin